MKKKLQYFVAFSIHNMLNVSLHLKFNKIISGVCFFDIVRYLKFRKHFLVQPLHLPVPEKLMMQNHLAESSTVIRKYNKANLIR